MKEKLRRSKEQLAQGFDAYSLVLISVFWKKIVYIYLLGSDKQFFIIGKVKIERVSHELKVKYGVLKSARGTVLTLFIFGFFMRIESFLNDSYRYFILFYLCSWKRIVWKSSKSSIPILFAHKAWGM